MSKYEVGDQFVIEISEVSRDRKNYYLKGFELSEFCLSESDLDSLEKVENSEPDESEFYSGVRFAEKVYKKLSTLSGFEISEIFKVEGGTAWAVIQKHSIQGIDKMIRDFKLDVKVGDEFILANKKDDDSKILITYIDEEVDSRPVYHYIHRSGRTGCILGSDPFMKLVAKRSSNDPTMSVAYKAASDFISKKDGE